jgi:hypothetical protein
MPRFKVTVERVEWSSTVEYVTAKTAAEAEELVESTLWEGCPEFETDDSEETFSAEPVGKHEVLPTSSGDRDTCLACGKPVHWTGRYENGETIPGPWKHGKKKGT